VENAFIESFNGRLRDGCLNAQVFLSLEDAPGKAGGVAKGLQHAAAAQLDRQFTAERVRRNAKNSC